MWVLCIHTLCAYFYILLNYMSFCYIKLFIPCDISITAYKLLYYYMIQQIQESIMAWKVDERIPEEMFVQLLAKKANIIKDHL